MRRQGISVIELLAVLAIIAIVLSIAVSILSHARADAKKGITFSNLRTHAQMFSAYASDSGDCYPYFTRPGFASTTLVTRGMSVAVSYFDAHRTWHLALADGYYGHSPFSRVFVSPEYSDDDGGIWPLYTPYHYACVFIADPRYWNPTTRTGPDQFAATRTAHVLFPSSKSLIIDTWPFQRAFAGVGKRRASLELAMVFADGAARTLRGGSWQNGYEKGDGYEFESDGAIHYTDLPPMLHTIDGVRGRDIP